MILWSGSVYAAATKIKIPFLQKRTDEFFMAYYSNMACHLC
jgi:hypothetical protein